LEVGEEEDRFQQGDDVVGGEWGALFECGVFLEAAAYGLDGWGSGYTGYMFEMSNEKRMCMSGMVCLRSSVFRCMESLIWYLLLMVMGVRMHVM
jgi:hypothetical protein